MDHVIAGAPNLSLSLGHDAQGEHVGVEENMEALLPAMLHGVFSGEVDEA